ncbi:hypothetical protein [Methylobacterium tardum]|uniref:hypothetical protein n=1 Tax=Methylobacterium tardum TaxID=374432 RepID=UPI00362358F0
MARYTRRTRLPEPEALDGRTLEMAGRLLLGPEWKRPLAKLLGPFHPDGPRETIDPRLPFRWTMEPTPGSSKPFNGRPIPGWVWPVLSELLHQRALDLAADARDAQRLHLEIGGLVRDGKKSGGCDGPQDLPRLHAPEILAAWVAKAQAAPFIRPIDLPTVRRAPAEPPPPAPPLFDRLPIQRKGERQRPAPPAPGTPLHVVLTEHLAGVISPPSALSLKRMERRAERQAKSKAK